MRLSLVWMTLLAALSCAAASSKIAHDLAYQSKRLSGTSLVDTESIVWISSVIWGSSVVCGSSVLCVDAPEQLPIAGEC